MPKAHDQNETHRYLIHFPDHTAREGDPNYVDFNHYHKQTRAAARCYIGERIGFGDCRDEKGTLCSIDSEGQQSGLELHHAHIEFSLQNAVSLEALEKDYPGVSDRDSLGAWVESAENFRWLCVHHHRGPAGAHSVAHSDFEASIYIQSLIGPITAD